MIKRLLDYNDGEDMDLVLLLKDSSLRTSKNGKQYLVLQFSDSSGTIRGNLWNASQQDADTFSPGTIVELSGKREEYQDRPQIRIYDLRVVGPNEGSDLQLSKKILKKKLINVFLKF